MKHWTNLRDHPNARIWVNRCSQPVISSFLFMTLLWYAVHMYRSKLSSTVFKAYTSSKLLCRNHYSARNGDSLRASPTVLSARRWKNISPPKFSYVLFPNPAGKPKTGTANRWESTNSNPNGRNKQPTQSTAGVKLCCAFNQPLHLVQKR